MTVEEIAARYVRVAEAARLLSTDDDRWDASKVYRAAQSGRLDALCVGGWVISRASIERYRVARERKTVPAA